MNSSSVWMLPLVCEYLTAFSDKDDLFSASTHLSRSPLSRDFLWLFFVAEVWDAGAVWCATPFEIPTSTEDTPPEKISSNYNRSFHHSTESLQSPIAVCSLTGLQTIRQKDWSTKTPGKGQHWNWYVVTNILEEPAAEGSSNSTCIGSNWQFYSSSINSKKETFKLKNFRWIIRVCCTV